MALSLEKLAGLKLPARLDASLRGILSNAFAETKRGFEELAAITKRTDDVAMNLDRLLDCGRGSGSGDQHLCR